ncbi:MAG: hypothetical protein ACON38_18195 [Akkermansiaceae bacterium]
MDYFLWRRPTIFDLGGGTLFNRKSIIQKNGAKVIGDVESIIDDV